ncbi:TPA: replication initiator protein A [Staphylococcus aureus]|nr:replication initiator protein A [Staphylococcus aureus]HDA5566063.1 replication initiator protein A [Staphylococcus aureus]
MPNFEKYNLSQVKTERFYQLPKYLFEDAYFKKMSAEAKIMYALLKDRFELSIQNEWVDKNNNIYFIFSNKHLCEYLGYAEQKIIKLKKELISFNLLTQERVGLNKPNRLYLLKPNYDIKASHSKELPNSQSNDTESNDTNDLNDNKLTFPSNHTNHSNHNNSNFNNEALKFQLLEELPQSIQRYLSNFSVNEIKIIKPVLLKAKTSFNNSIDTYYLLEDMEIEILHVLKRFKAMLIQKNETVEAMQGYLMKSLKSEFAEMHTLNKRRDHLPITSLFNQ